MPRGEKRRCLVVQNSLNEVIKQHWKMIFCPWWHTTGNSKGVHQRKDFIIKLSFNPNSVLIHSVEISSDNGDVSWYFMSWREKKMPKGLCVKKKKKKEKLDWCMLILVFGKASWSSLFLFRNMRWHQILGSPNRYGIGGCFMSHFGSCAHSTYLFAV